MTAKEFFFLVVDMRQTQKNWFKTKNREYLERSKELEKRVDKEIERVQDIANEPELNFK